MIFPKRKTLKNVSPSSQLQLEKLEDRMMLSSVQIFAAGTTGEEVIELEVAGAVVQTFSNLGTGADDGSYVELNYSTSELIAADDVRINFTNDLYEPENGIDRNVRVDGIVIDDQRFETEDPQVFSTGTWLPADGVEPGFRLSETIHTNGYFQFAGDAVNPGDPPRVIINEILYNPADALDGDAEFLELYNPGSEAADLSGMSFVGFTLTFAPGTILGAGEYAIVAPSSALAQSTWGVTPLAEFEAGGLSGGGELIQLLAADGVTVVDEVSYDDVAPWPNAPDGNGPSLELIDIASDNSVAVSWAASNGDPTPGAENSVVDGVQEGITDITVSPGQPLPDQAFNISATIANATFANLTYRIGFNGSDVVVAMTNVGGDLWEATVPGQSAGELVRYRITSDVAVAPFAGDSINYLGVVVSPTDIADNSLPVFQYWVDEAQFAELTTTELALTNTKIPVVVAYGNQVVDNATVRVRGGDHSRTFFPKKSLKFELPSGYAFDVGAEGSYPIDEFGINADFGDWSVVNPDISWDVFNAETESFTSSFFTRVEQNGDFWGVFRFQELYDGAWRMANGFDGDEFYKADRGGFGTSAQFDKKRPEDDDFTSIELLNDVLTAPPSAAKTAWLYENVDIPSAVNHMALSALTRHDDQRVQNFYVALDSETNKWSIIEWDLDRLWEFPSDGDGGEFTTPESIQNEYLDSFFDVPEFQDMYWRRIQTLVDTYLGNDDLIERRAELIEQIGPTNSSLEFAQWGRTDIYPSTYFADEWQDSIDGRRAAFAAESRMPGSATGNNNIVINELHYNPAGDDAEFLELFNNSNESVDLSGWEIDGVGLTIGFGTVILPNQYLVFTDNLIQFNSQATGNIFVGAQYSGGLSGGGEAVTLLDRSGNIVDQVTYSDSDPWTSEPDGDGFSLALTNPNLDNRLATSWVASTQVNGTPGTSNDLVVAPSTEIKIFAAGNSGSELIGLRIGGVQVATYDLGLLGGSAGDLSNRNFIELTYFSDVPFSASDVRVEFLNDTYDPANGVDFNVAIDRIEIDGEIFETEAPNVFSTGTYVSALGGFVPGFRQSEILHGNGYFQFEA